MCLIRNRVVPFVRKLNSDNDLVFVVVVVVVVLLEKALFGITKEVAYACSDVMPQGSPTTMYLRWKVVLSYWRDVCLIYYCLWMTCMRFYALIKMEEPLIDFLILLV